MHQVSKRHAAYWYTIGRGMLDFHSESVKTYYKLLVSEINQNGVLLILLLDLQTVS